VAKYSSLAARIVLLFIASAQAQSPGVKLGAANDDQLAPPVAPQMQVSETFSASIDSASADLVQSPDVWQDQASCMTCGSPTQQMTCREKFQYYRGVRQAFDRSPYCDCSAAGFGALWNTYCYDRQGCCAQTQGSASCRRCDAPRPRKVVEGTLGRIPYGKMKDSDKALVLTPHH